MARPPFSIHCCSNKTTYSGLCRYSSLASSLYQFGLFRTTSSRVSVHVPSRHRCEINSKKLCLSLLKTCPIHARCSSRPIHLMSVVHQLMKVEVFETDNLLKILSVFRNNFAYANNFMDAKYVEVSTGRKNYVLTLGQDDFSKLVFPVDDGTIHLSSAFSKWTSLRKGQEVEVKPIDVDTVLSSVVLEVYERDGSVLTELSPTLLLFLNKIFPSEFKGYVLTEGQPLLFYSYHSNDGSTYLLVVTRLELVDADTRDSDASADKNEGREVRKMGVCSEGTTIECKWGENSNLNLNTESEDKIDSSSDSISNTTTKRKVVRKPLIINNDFDKLGIGGLEEEFGLIFRRALASRMFPPEIVETLGLKHVKGMLLYGPPGTGKTLIARQIGKMLDTREPKIVSGPEICSKWYGESEEKIRSLFKEAEYEEKNAGPKSGLHLIIFDEIDSICRTRDSTTGGANDRVVNQLLTKLDGVKQLNNILVIGTTNRRDMIDAALLRPGRLEIQLEIGLPDEKGRLQILSIHTSKMYENNMIADDVNLQELVSLTRNYSGAELAGVVRAAQSMGMNRLIKETSADGVQLEPEVAKNLKIRRDDFLNAIENDIKPTFGTSLGVIEAHKDRGIIEWGPPVGAILAEGDLLIEQLRNLPVERKGGLVSVLLEGAPNSGKTALAAEIAQRTCFPFIKICTKKDMFGLSELETCSRIREIFEEAYKCESSCVLVDNVETLFNFNAFGPSYSNTIVQALNISLTKEPPKGRRLLILCTTSMKVVLHMMRVILPSFTDIVHVPNLTNCDEISRVLAQSESFSSPEIEEIATRLRGTEICIGIKKLLTLIDFVRQIGVEQRVTTFVKKLKEESDVDRK